MNNNTPPAIDLSLLDLPHIISAASTENMMEHQTRIIDLAKTFLSQSHPALGDLRKQSAIRTHLDAVALASELLALHASMTMEDEAPHYCAEQLMAWHLREINLLIPTL